MRSPPYKASRDCGDTGEVGPYHKYRNTWPECTIYELASPDVKDTCSLPRYSR